VAVTAEEWTTKPFDMISPGVRPPRGAEWGAVSKGIAPFRFLSGELEIGPDQSEIFFQPNHY